MFYAEHFGLDLRVHDDTHLLILGSSEGALLALSEGDPPARPDIAPPSGVALPMAR